MDMKFDKNNSTTPGATPLLRPKSGFPSVQTYPNTPKGPLMAKAKQNDMVNAHPRVPIVPTVGLSQFLK